MLCMPWCRENVLDVAVSDIQVFDRPAAAPAPPAPPAVPAPPAGGGNSGAATQAEVSAAAAAVLGCYQMPAAVAERVVVVECDAGLRQLEQALFGGCGSPSSPSSPSSSSSASEAAGAEPSDGGGIASDGVGAAPGEGPAAQPRGFARGVGGASLGDSLPGSSFRLVVGMDCEWVPYRRGDPHTPVSLLQASLHTSVCVPAAAMLLPDHHLPPWLTLKPSLPTGAFGPSCAAVPAVGHTRLGVPSRHACPLRRRRQQQQRRKRRRAQP